MFARSSKFSLFDPAKEMVYIEMPAEEKRKGKAAVDLVGSQARLIAQDDSSSSCPLSMLLTVALGGRFGLTQRTPTSGCPCAFCMRWPIVQ